MSADYDTSHPDKVLLWTTRRRMAWTGLVFSMVAWVVGLVLGIVFPFAAQTAIVPLTTMAFWGGLMPMGAYIGNLASDAFAEARKMTGAGRTQEQR